MPRREIEGFNVEVFIDEVEKRPVIWDTKNKDYSNKIIKRYAWQELAELFAGDNDSTEKKAILRLILQKKWKNVRDAYIKEYRKMKSTSASGIQKRANYVFYSRLSFLHSSVDNKRTTCIKQQEESIEELEKDKRRKKVNTSHTENIRRIPKKKKLPNSSVDERFTELIDKIQANVTNQDEDKMFCSSLHTELKKVPEDRRLETKIELLRVLQKAQV